MDPQNVTTEPEEIPQYTEFALDGLIPITTFNNNRYVKQASVSVEHVRIYPGLFHFMDGPEPEYLPPGWTAYTHPEGKLYFYRDFGLQVVTEAYLYRESTLEKILTWTKCIEEALRTKGLTPSARTELFLQPSEDMKTCGYYLADHANRTQFWIDQASTELLELPAVVSSSHLRCLLEQLYWQHVEYFPMHYKGLTCDNVNDLISIFSQGQIDHMTSSNSTFVYNAEQSAKFIQILKVFRKQKMDGNINWVVARMWHNIVHHRFTNHAGQEFTRLDRDQTIFGDYPAMDHPKYRLCSALCFGLPDVHYRRMSKMFVDYEVYGSDYNTFMNECQDDWKSSTSWSLPLLLSNIFLLSIPSASSIFGTSAITVSGMSALAGIALSVWHHGYDKDTVERAYAHLAAIKSETYGFRAPAVIYSLPRSLCLWAVGLLMVNIMLLTARLVHTSVAVVWVALVLLLVLGAVHVLSDKDACPLARVFENWFNVCHIYGKSFLRSKSSLDIESDETSPCDS